jgi:hypothetical protein
MVWEAFFFINFCSSLQDRLALLDFHLFQHYSGFIRINFSENRPKSSVYSKEIYNL